MAPAAVAKHEPTVSVRAKFGRPGAARAVKNSAPNGAWKIPDSLKSHRVRWLIGRGVGIVREGTFGKIVAQVWLPPTCIDQRLLMRLFADASTVL